MKIGKSTTVASNKFRVASWAGVLLATCHLLLGTVFAADFQISASLDRNQIALNEQAVLSLTLSGDVSRLPTPPLPNLQDFQVSNAGTSQNFSWVNGKATSSLVYTFVLTPLKEGRFTIPAWQVTFNGQTAETQPLPLEVVKGNAAALPEGTARPMGNPPAQRSGEPAIFIQGAVDKSTVYVGEPVTYVFGLYNRVPLMGQPRYQAPEMTGFWTEDLPPQRNYTTSVKGVPYNVTEVRTALFPSAPGKSRVGPAALSVSIENIGSDPFSNNFFSQFFGRGEERTLRTEPVTIHVKPLPDPKPAGFKGAVGHYTLSASVDKDRVAVGQPLTLTLTISGKGNIKSLPEIPLPALINFRTFDANAATNIEKKNYEVQGSKVYKTVLIPTASGNLFIPAVPFVFFNPTAGAYKTVLSQPFTIRVDAGAGTSAPAGPAGSVGVLETPGIRLLGEDIRYIQTPVVVQPQEEFLYRRREFRWLHGILLVLLAGLGLFRLYQIFFFSNTALARFRRAKARALHAARLAEAALGTSDNRRACEILSGGLQAFIGDKLTQNAYSLALKQVVPDLKDRGVSPHNSEKVRNLWETLDLYRFAPAQVRPEEIRQAIRSFEHVIEEMEKEITWK
ncbi:MAG: BatD family protein [Elusimicrobiota bacterium]|jgi:hypothetical protein